MSEAADQIPDPRAHLTAAERGVTPLQVATRTGRTLREVLAVYVWGDLRGRPPIGRIDRFNCWFASPDDVCALFGAIGQGRAEAATKPDHLERTAARMMRRRLRAGGA